MPSQPRRSYQGDSQQNVIWVAALVTKSYISSNHKWKKRRFIWTSAKQPMVIVKKNKQNILTGIVCKKVKLNPKKWKRNTERLTSNSVIYLFIYLLTIFSPVNRNESPQLGWCAHTVEPSKGELGLDHHNSSQQPLVVNNNEGSYMTLNLDWHNSSQQPLVVNNNEGSYMTPNLDWHNYS